MECGVDVKDYECYVNRCPSSPYHSTHHVTSQQMRVSVCYHIPLVVERKSGRVTGGLC